MKNNKILKTNVRTGGQTLLNKGFTLIELLAVIIILAIIAVIAVPIVLNIIKETKEKSYDISVENIMRSAKIYDLESELNDTTILMDQNIYDELKKKLNGTAPDDGTVYLKSSLTGEKREIAFALKYGEWCYTKAYGDPSYEKKKTNECNVPFDYLIQGKFLSSKQEYTNYGPTDLFLWRDGIGDETKAIKREQIESIEVKPSDKVSESAIYSWDVSENKTGKVMAWYEDIDNNGLYEVYIGQNGGVKTRDNAQYLFAYLSNVKTIDLKYFDTSQVTQMAGMFYVDNNLTKLDISNFNTSRVGTDKQHTGSMQFMFAVCKSLTQLDVSHFDTSNVTSMASMFQSCSSLITLDVSNWDTSNVKSMGSLFEKCNKLTNLDVSNFDTSKVTSMSYMFYNCQSLKELDVSHFNTSQVINMYYMFFYCKLLTRLDVSGFNTSKVENMGNMFEGCKLLTQLDVSHFDTSNVKNMSYMFSNCGSLISLNLNNFNTENVTTMDRMFLNCSGIKTLDISNFNTTKVVDMTGMFAGATNLKPIFVGENFQIPENSTKMFYTCATLTVDQLCTPSSTHSWCVLPSE